MPQLFDANVGSHFPPGVFDLSRLVQKDTSEMDASLLFVAGMIARDMLFPKEWAMSQIVPVPVLGQALTALAKETVPDNFGPVVRTFIGAMLGHVTEAGKLEQMAPLWHAQFVADKTRMDAERVAAEASVEVAER